MTKRNRIHDMLMNANIHRINGLLYIIDERTHQQINPNEVMNLMANAVLLYKAVERNAEFMETTLNLLEDSFHDAEVNTQNEQLAFQFQHHISACKLMQRKITEGR